MALTYFSKAIFMVDSLLPRIDDCQFSIEDLWNFFALHLDIKEEGAISKCLEFGPEQKRPEAGMLIGTLIFFPRPLVRSPSLS